MYKFPGSNAMQKKEKHSPYLTYSKDINPPNKQNNPCRNIVSAPQELQWTNHIMSTFNSLVYPNTHTHTPLTCTAQEKCIIKSYRSGQVINL